MTGVRLETGIDLTPVTVAELGCARRYVAGRATSTTDAIDLLDALGIGRVVEILIQPHSTETP